MEHATIEYGVRALSLQDAVTLTVRHSNMRSNHHRVTSGHIYAAAIYASGNFTLTLEESLLVDNWARVHAPSGGISMAGTSISTGAARSSVTPSF
jgi:hypothetical protein